MDADERSHVGETPPIKKVEVGQPNPAFASGARLYHGFPYLTKSVNCLDSFPLKAFGAQGAPGSEKIPFCDMVRQGLPFSQSVLNSVEGPPSLQCRLQNETKALEIIPSNS